MKIKFLKGVLLSSALLLILTICFENSSLIRTLTSGNQFAAVVKSTKTENIYNIKPSKTPGIFSFNYNFAKTSKGKETPFDLPIIPFDETKAGGITDFGLIRDAWGYPVQENAFTGQVKSPSKKQSKNIFNIQKALAYDIASGDGSVYNCRASTSINGYFKAYFEDVELNTNIGYDDEVFGEGRRAEACQVLQDLGELVMLGGTGVTPDILFSRSDTPVPPNALAGASSYFGYYTVGPDNGSLHKHIITRQDPTPGAGDFDAFVITNFTGDIEWSVDSNLNTSTYDLYSVLYHEIMHTLGFRGSLPAVIPVTNISQRYGTFDFFSYENETLINRFINIVTNFVNVPVGAPSPWFVTNQVVYRGVKNILNATPDGVRPVYSPINWQQGSSLSHFDMNRAPGEVYIMHPSIGTNIQRSIHQDEKEVLCHLRYMVEGVEGCEVPTSVAVDDYAPLNETEPVCINLLGNDINPSGLLSDLRINTLELTSIQTGDIVEYFTDTNCSGIAQPNPFGARSILLTFTSDTAIRVLTYTNKNIVTNRFSFPAKIFTIQSCESINDSDEYVCNGDFEIGPNIDISQPFACGNSWSLLSYVPFWCQLIGSPELPQHSSGFLWENYTNLPFDCDNAPAPSLHFFNGCEVSAPSGDGKTAFILRGINQNMAQTREGILNKLKTPLNSGEEYTLSFDAFVIVQDTDQSWSINGNPDFINSTSIKFGLYDSPQIIISSYANVPEADQIIYNNDIPFNVLSNQWTHIEQNFIPSDEYQFLGISPDIEYSIEHEQWIPFYLDNISIRPVNTPALPQNRITGTVYQDLNENGSQQISIESGLSGIQVGLFQTGSSTPIQIALTQDIPQQGKYEFNNLPNGNYFTALIGEDIYPSITEPVSNSILSGYDFAHTQTLSGNSISEDNDFGLTLNINTFGCTDKDAPNYNPQAIIDDGSCLGNAIIKGILYEDLNGNGNRDANEPGISNKQIGLYIPGQVTPTEITTTGASPILGAYTFENVFLGTHYVAIINEQEFPFISEPPIYMDLVANHNHVHNLDIQPTPQIYYADFGVVRGKNVADIDVRKTFTDSSVSVFDRSITWEIDVTNFGPADATNVNISDIIPAGLVHTGYTTISTNTYNTDTGVFHIPSLPQGQTVTLTITVRVPSSTCGLKTNTATLISLDQIDANSLNNQSSSSKDFGFCAKPTRDPRGPK